MKTRRPSREALVDQIRGMTKAAQENDARTNQIRAGIEDLYAEHFPLDLSSDDWQLKLGNTPNGSELLTCKECSHAWPCKPWNDYRNLYAITYGHTWFHEPDNRRDFLPPVLESHKVGHVSA